MKKLYEQSPEMHLSGKRHLRHVKCTHHKGYLMEDLSMIKSGFYEISFCKSGDFLFRIGQKRHFITNGDILVIPPDIPHYFTSSDLVANYYDFITVWLEKSYISNLKSQLPALEESFSILTHLIFFILPISCAILRKNLKPFTGNMLLMGSFPKPMPVVHPPVFW